MEFLMIFFYKTTLYLSMFSSNFSKLLAERLFITVIHLLSKIMYFSHTFLSKKTAKPSTPTTAKLKTIPRRNPRTIVRVWFGSWEKKTCEKMIKCMGRADDDHATCKEMVMDEG